MLTCKVSLTAYDNTVGFFAIDYDHVSCASYAHSYKTTCHSMVLLVGWPCLLQLHKGYILPKICYTKAHYLLSIIVLFLLNFPFLVPTCTLPYQSGVSFWSENNVSSILFFAIFVLHYVFPFHWQLASQLHISRATRLQTNVHTYLYRHTRFKNESALPTQKINECILLSCSHIIFPPKVNQH